LALQRSTIIDGGTLSNFPVWLFDVDAPTLELKRPTFGFTLTGGRGVGAGFNAFVRRLPWAVRFGSEIFHTSQEAWDARFVSQSTRVRTVAVDAGTIATTQFNLSKDDREFLLGSGRDAAKRFLERFDLTEYENTYHRRFGDVVAQPVVPAPAAAVGH
jgi:NTE family protein